MRNLSAIPNKEIPQAVLNIINGDEYRKQRLLYGMNRYLTTGVDKLNWGE
jgi:hypothetical protein